MSAHQHLASQCLLIFCQANRCQVVSHSVFTGISLMATEAPDPWGCLALCLAPLPLGLTLSSVSVSGLRTDICPFGRLWVPASPLCSPATLPEGLCLQTQFWSLISLGSKPAPAPISCATLTKGLNLSELQSPHLQTRKSFPENSLR